MASRYWPPTTFMVQRCPSSPLPNSIGHNSVGIYSILGSSPHHPHHPRGPQFSTVGIAWQWTMESLLPSNQDQEYLHHSRSADCRWYSFYSKQIMWICTGHVNIAVPTCSPVITKPNNRVADGIFETDECVWDCFLPTIFIVAVLMMIIRK